MRTNAGFLAPPVLPSPEWHRVGRVSARTPFSDAPVVVGGVPIDRVTMSEALERLDRMVAGRAPRYVVTANADFLTQARRDVELRRILLEADLVLCDGTPLVWASRWLGCPIPERVAGSDLALPLLSQAEKKGYRLFLLGASADTNAAAVERLRRLFPRLNIVGNYAPPYQPLLEMDHEEIKRRVRAAAPDVLMVSFGCPKQEKWISMHYRSLEVPVCLGVGATIDFLAQRVKRAPLWARKAGLEWCFRLAREPRRMCKRYADDFLHFGAATLAQLWEMRFRPRTVGPAKASKILPAASPESVVHVRAGGSLDAAALAREEGIWLRAARAERHCLLDLSEARFVDSAGMGMIALLHRELGSKGRRLVLISPSGPARRALRLMRLEDLFLTAPDAEQALALAEKTSGLGGEHEAEVSGTAWRGEITAANAGRVWALAAGQIEGLSSKRFNIEIDLSALRYIDTSGLKVMLGAARLAQARGCKLRFTRPKPMVQNVLKLAKARVGLLAEA